MKPVKLLSLLDVLQFENTHRKRTILGVVELSGCWGFGFGLVFFRKTVLLSQGPTIPSLDQTAVGNLPPPHPSQKLPVTVTIPSVGTSSQLSLAEQKQAGTPACTPAQQPVPSCPLKHHQDHFCSLWLCRRIPASPGTAASLTHVLNFSGLNKRKSPQIQSLRKTLHQAKDKSPREEDEPSHTPTHVWPTA